MITEPSYKLFYDYSTTQETRLSSLQQQPRDLYSEIKRKDLQIYTQKKPDL